MILLEAGNRLIADTVRTVIIPDADYKPIAFEAKLNDFDNAAFLIEVPEENVESIRLSLDFPSYRDIKDYGAKNALENAYGEFLQPEPQEGYDITLVVQKEAWVGREEEIITKLSELKRVVLGGIFDHYLSTLNKKNTSTLTNFKFDLRHDTTVYFIPLEDRVTIVYHLSFIDKADMEIGRVFLNQFADPSLRRTVQRAPIVTFDINPPVALKAFGVETAKPDDVGFVSFTILELHCADNVRAKAVDSLAVFRNFVQYHLKCAKSYFNSRMRARVVDFIKVLNRAKMVEDSQPKRITTAAGRFQLK